MIRIPANMGVSPDFYKAHRKNPNHAVLFSDGLGFDFTLTKININYAV